MSGSGDNTLKVWDVATGKCVATLEGHSDEVRCGVRCTFCDDVSSLQVYDVAVFPDGLRVVSASGDGTLKVWELLTGECVRTLEGHRIDTGLAVVMRGANDASVRHCVHFLRLST